MVSHHAICTKTAMTSSTLRRLHLHVNDPIFAVFGRTESDGGIVDGLTPELLFSESVLDLMIQEQVNRRIGSEFLRTSIFRAHHHFPAVNFVGGVLDHAVPAKLVIAGSNGNHVFLQGFVFTDGALLAPNLAGDGLSEGWICIDRL